MQKNSEETALKPIVISLKDKQFEENIHETDWFDIASSQPIIKYEVQKNSKAELKFTLKSTVDSEVILRIALTSESCEVIASSPEYKARRRE